MKTLRIGVVGSLVLAGVALTSVSAAQDAEPAPAATEPAAGAKDEGDRGGERRDRGEDEDGARFRGGIRAEGGVLIVPDAGEVLPAVGVQGNIGAQINDLVGVYWAPSLDIIFGDFGGVNLGSAILVDFTFDDSIQVGVGPDVGVFAATSSTTAGAAALYGGRLHFAYFPIVGEGESPIRRKGLALGVDVRLLTGGIAVASTSGASAAGNTFVMAPMAFVGYEAF